MRIFLLLISFSCSVALAQTGPIRPKMIVHPNPNPTRWNANILFTDVQGRPFANLYSGIEGSAYLLPDYRWGQLETNSGKTYDSLQMMLDLYHHELHVILNGKEIVAQDGMIKWISIRDTIEGKVSEYIFQSGFPSFEKNSSSHFYQILSAGDHSLLLHRGVELEKTTDVMSGLTRERFVPIEQLFVYDGKDIRKLERTSNFLDQLFQDRLALYQHYRRSHRVNVKNREQLIQLFDAMNAGEKKAF